MAAVTDVHQWVPQSNGPTVSWFWASEVCNPDAGRTGSFLESGPVRRGTLLVYLSVLGGHGGRSPFTSPCLHTAVLNPLL